MRRPNSESYLIPFKVSSNVQVQAVLPLDTRLCDIGWPLDLAQAQRGAPVTYSGLG